MINQGLIYSELKKENSYSDDLKSCIEETVQKLLDNDTTVNKPGMLLGKIQSGKTKAFIGIIGLAFDNDYDIAIVLTKGTKALAQQTFQRLEQEFSEFKDNDQIQIFDIMNLPDNLTPWELKQKIIFISKKQTHNLDRLRIALFETYPELSGKRILIIDDEADFASIGFKRTKDEGIEIRQIASQIDGIRGVLKEADFLQVTATPYSLYLQPEDLAIDEKKQYFEPIKPAFTNLVPVHEKYIGGNYYFEESEEQNSVASFIYQEVPLDEINILRKQDRRVFKIEDSLTSNKIIRLRSAVVNFIVGGCIRRIQDRVSGKPEKKFSFIVHTEQRKISHEWQENIVREIHDQLIEVSKMNTALLGNLINESYENLSKSINILNIDLPSFQDVEKEVYDALHEGLVMITVVNSKKNIDELLDNQGQLKLRTPLNIFIGGQILDRGITIRNLIGFYYGRRPNTFQQDTVLQHSRMYGFRPLEDLTVTRFYTTLDIHKAMRNIHEFDSALRDAFLRGAHSNGIVFIRRDDSNRIVPCSPNKILLSTTTTLSPFKRILPVGFQTGYKSNILSVINKLDEVIQSSVSNLNISEPFLIDLETAKEIIDLINQTLEFEDGYNWDVSAFKASMEYLSKNPINQSQNGKIWCLVRLDRNLSRCKTEGGFSDSPDTPKTEGKIARETANDIPILMLFRQNGLKEKNWRDCPFWWPVLMVPKQTPTVIFASDITEN